MAIRRNSRYDLRWYYEDSLEYEVPAHPKDLFVYDPDKYYPLYIYAFDLELNGEGFWTKYPDKSDPIQFRRISVKLFDEPPYSRQELFNNEVGYIEYEVQGKLITIVSWGHTWRDEWPIRLGLNYLTNCLYRPGQGYLFRVIKDPIAFWQSERFIPVSGVGTADPVVGSAAVMLQDDPYIVRTPVWIP